MKVIKLISKDSIEDNMLRLGQKKLKLEQDMTAADASKHTILEKSRSLLQTKFKHHDLKQWVLGGEF